MTGGTRRLAGAGLTLACCGVLLALLSAAFIWEQGVPWRHAAQAVGPAAGALRAAPSNRPLPTPTSPGDIVRNPNPRTLTLRLTDLPAGYHVVKEGEASFSSGASTEPPPSWDAVFGPDQGQATGFQLVESLAVVYPSVAQASDAFQAMGSAEDAAHAVQQEPSSSFGDRLMVWVEPEGAGAGNVIVRVTWQSMNVIGQVSVLGQSGSIEPDQPLALARLEQDRIGSPAPLQTAHT